MTSTSAVVVVAAVNRGARVLPCTAVVADRASARALHKSSTGPVVAPTLHPVDPGGDPPPPQHPRRPTGTAPPATVAGRDPRPRPPDASAAPVQIPAAQSIAVAGRLPIEPLPSLFCFGPSVRRVREEKR